MHIFAHTKMIDTITDYLFMCLVYYYYFLFIVDIDQFMFMSFWDRYHSNLYCWAVASVQCLFLCVLIIWFDWGFYNQLNYFYLDSDWHVNFDILLNSVKSSLCFVSQVVDTLLHWYVSCLIHIYGLLLMFTPMYMLCVCLRGMFLMWSYDIGLASS